MGNVDAAASIVGTALCTTVIPMASADFIGGGVPADNFPIDDTLLLENLLPGELRMRSPYTSYPTLEEFRQRSLQASYLTSSLSGQGRAVILLALNTEFRAVFNTLFPLGTYNIKLNLSNRQKAVLVDGQLSILAPAYEKALSELRQLGVPFQYTDLFRVYLNSTSFNHRVAAICACVWTAGIILDS